MTFFYLLFSFIIFIVCLYSRSQILTFFFCFTPTMVNRNCHPRDIRSFVGLLPFLSWQRSPDHICKMGLAVQLFIIQQESHAGAYNGNRPLPSPKPAPLPIRATASLSSQAFRRGGHDSGCRYLVDRVFLHIGFKSTQGAGCASTRCHVLYSFRSRLPADVGSGAATCPVAPGSHPCHGGLWRCHVSPGLGPHLLVDVSSGAVTCPLASNLVSLLRWALVLLCVPWL
jgi:hypothetical protein